VTTRRQVAKRPAPRIADIELAGYPGWAATVRVDFPARIAIDAQSGDVPRVVAALEAIVVSHNFPNEAGEPAESLADVDAAALAALSAGIGEALTRLPPR